MSEIKFSEEELKSLQELSQKYQAIQAGFGQARVQKMVLEQQMDALEEAESKLESDWVENQETERSLVAELTEKYGPGTLNPETGVFVPTPQPEAEAQPEVVEES